MATTTTPPDTGRAPRLAAALSESTMGFLAIVALALALVPFVFVLTPEIHLRLDGVEWAIVALFALEYVVSLARADDRLAFVLSGWRLLDLVIIVAPLATIAFPHAEALRATPVLRLVRAGLYFARLGTTVRRRASAAAPPPPPGPSRVTVVRGNEPPRETTWDDVLQGIARPPADEWYHASALDARHTVELGKQLGIAPRFIAQTLGTTAYPRVEVYDRFSAVFLWIPNLGEGDALVVRHGVLLITTEHGLLSLCRDPLALQEDAAGVLEGLGLGEAPLGARVLLSVLKLALRRYEEVAGHLELEARDLELVPVHESTPEFLGRSFRLQRQVSALRADLWRLKGILRSIQDGRLEVHGLPVVETPAAHAAREALSVLVDEAEYVYETAFNAREGLLALIDLHLNVVSFEMNKVMRLLAVVSALGLVPTVVGGLLGMNLEGNPWPATLGQVTFVVGFTMAVLLYSFLARGWLR